MAVETTTSGWCHRHDPWRRDVVNTICATAPPIKLSDVWKWQDWSNWFGSSSDNRKLVGALTEVVGKESVSTPESAGSRRFIDRLDPRLVNVLTVLGFSLPVVIYFWMIARYSVNVIYQDQWRDITVIEHSHSHFIDWGSLWSQYNEDRMFFPNLIVTILARGTHFNIRVEDLLSGIMLVLATLLIIFSHKRRSPLTPWLYYCPVLILACSTVQYAAALWGFQMAWYLVLLALAATVALVDRVTLTWPVLGLAIVTAVVGAYSLVQGLLIWPIGLLLLYNRRRSVRFLAVWIIAAALSTALYLYNFNFTTGSVFPPSLTRHSISPLYFAIFAVGDIVGYPVKFGGDNPAILLLGVLLVALAVVTLVLFGFRRNDSGGAPVGIALICFGLMFAGLVAKGRAPLGFWAASSSGYTMYDLFIPIGIYLTLIGRQPQADNRRDGARAITSPSDPASSRGRTTRVALLAVAWAVAAVMLLQVVTGIGNGLAGARSINSAELKAASIERSIDHSTDEQLLANLAFYQSPSITRRLARIARELRLSAFSADDH